MNNKELAQKTVDRMLDLINTTGRLPWAKPWGEGEQTKLRRVDDGATVISIPVRHWSRNGKPYQGVNTWLLQTAGKHGEMITFAQCKKEGGNVKKGAKAATIIYWTMLVKKEDETDENGKPVLDENGEVKQRVVKIPVLKEYKVFSVEEDCEGLKVKHNPGPIEITVPKYHYEQIDGLDSSNYDMTAEAIIASYVARANGLTISRDELSGRAFYSPLMHSVTVPSIVQFDAIAEYYSTLFHELGHSTGHESLLNRFTGKSAIAAWGDDNYSREELVAEITAATILNELGLESGNSFRNSAAYVKGWSEQIKKDPMTFITAASRAEKAINLILNIAG